MKTWAKILGVVAVLAVGVAVAAEVTTVTGINGIKFRLSEASWRYKMTVNVETPEGIKTGSAVREVTVKLVEPEIQGLYQTRTFVKGEAIAVDLGHRGILFAIMDTDGSYQVVFDAFPGPSGFSKEGLEHYGHLAGSKIISDPKKYPEYAQLVTFSDLNNPLTVKGVHPENLSSAFGEGVAIKDMVIEMTGEPITEKIKKWLPWLSTNKGGYLDGQFAGGGPELSNILHGGNFKQGESQ
ncbi:MAG: hypothetical protein WBK77_06795 [Alphaproteobacteria bacterium]